MDKLHRDELVLLALQLDLPDILSLCNSSKYFNEKICKNENFWRRKIELERPGLIKFINNEKLSFRDIYILLKSPGAGFFRRYSIKVKKDPLEIIAVAKGYVKGNDFVEINSFHDVKKAEVGDKVWIVASFTSRFGLDIIMASSKEYALKISKMLKNSIIQQVIIV